MRLVRALWAMAGSFFLSLLSMKTFPLRGRSLGRSWASRTLMIGKEENMESMKDYFLRLKGDAYPDVDLFLRWYLRREVLVDERVVGKLLEDMETGKVVNGERWANRLRSQLLKGSLEQLRSLLNRPANLNELLQIYERVDEFIRSYVRGLGMREKKVVIGT